MLAPWRGAVGGPRGELSGVFFVKAMPMDIVLMVVTMMMRVMMVVDMVMMTMTLMMFDADDGADDNGDDSDDGHDDRGDGFDFDETCDDECGDGGDDDCGGDGDRDGDGDDDDDDGADDDDDEGDGSATSSLHVALPRAPRCVPPPFSFLARVLHTVPPKGCPPVVSVRGTHFKIDAIHLGTPRWTSRPRILALRPKKRVSVRVRGSYVSVFVRSCVFCVSACL